MDKIGGWTDDRLRYSNSRKWVCHIIPGRFNDSSANVETHLAKRYVLLVCVLCDEEAQVCLVIESCVLSFLCRHTWLACQHYFLFAVCRGGRRNDGCRFVQHGVAACCRFFIGGWSCRCIRKEGQSCCLTRRCNRHLTRRTNPRFARNRTPSQMRLNLSVRDFA